MPKAQISLFLLIFLVATLLFGCRGDRPKPTPTPQPVDLAHPMVLSPGGLVKVDLNLIDGVAYYEVSFKDKVVLLPSRLGFVFEDGKPLNQDFEVNSAAIQLVDETWTQVWGEVEEIRNYYNELRVELQEKTSEGRKLDLVFRVYDDGIGFRYEIPEQDFLKHIEIKDEETEFVMAGDHNAWFIAAYQRNRYEYLYMQKTISWFLSSPFRAVHTPLTMETGDGLFLTIHEAGLTDYSAMSLAPGEGNKLKADLAPWSDGVRVRGVTPFKSPWRTIQIAEQPGDLVTNYLILNLNEPNRLDDVSWIEPGKYVGVWWEMHLDISTWGPGPEHGATTENVKRYIDFAGQNGFEGVLVEGWNVGWDGDWWVDGTSFRFDTPNDDYDIEALSKYASERGVRLVGHHETSAAVQHYESNLDAAFAYARDHGINTIKTGYVSDDPLIRRVDENGKLIGFEWHYGQFMVEHYRKVVETAAKYGIMLVVHEPVKATGIRRTYPNMLSREGGRGQEYNAWSGGGNPPSHTTILPFTRLLAGPMDFTPGIFDLLFEEARPHNRVNTTLAKQLALYVVIYSPMQMAADLPQNYFQDGELHPMFQFILDVPVDWKETRVLHAAIGDYITIVRKDRNSDDWYLGSISDEEGRTLEAKLDFLTAGVTYVAEIYADGPGGDWEGNPLAYDMRKVLVDSETTYQIVLAPGGGQAIRFRLASDDELGFIPEYAP